MSEIIKPTWEDLREVVNCASTRLMICSPFYSAEGLWQVVRHWNNSASLKFWTRLSPPDWLRGFSDPPELLNLLDMLNSDGIDVELEVYRRLHAKAYAADEALALVGSANLSEGGFGANLELSVRFSGGEAVKAINDLEEFCAPFLQSITLEDLQEWVEFSRPTVEEARSLKSQELEVLEPVQSKLDQILDFGGTDSSRLEEPELTDMEEFVQWLENNFALSGAEYAYDAHYGRNQYSGHFKQGFFASMRFLSEHPDLRMSLSDELKRLSPDDQFKLNRFSQVAETWQEHLDAHAMDKGSHYSYSTLRSILPASLGGTLSGGGGAGPTIQRILPLVAQFVLDNET